MSARPDNSRPQNDDLDRKGLTAHYELDGSFSDISGRYQHGRMIAGDPTFDIGQIGRAATFDGDTEVSFGNVASFDRADPFSLAVWMRPRGNLPIAGFQKLDGPEHRRGFEWRFDDFALFDIQRWAGRLTITIASDPPANAIKVRTRERIKFGEWNHVVMSYDGSGKARGLAIYVNGERLAVDVVQDALAGPIRTDAPLTLGRARARAVVHRSDRRPSSLQPRPDRGRGRRSGDSLQGRARSSPASTASAPRIRRSTCANTSSTTRPLPRCAQPRASSKRCRNRKMQRRSRFRRRW